MKTDDELCELAHAGIDIATMAAELQGQAGEQRDARHSQIERAVCQAVGVSHEVYEAWLSKQLNTYLLLMGGQMSDEQQQLN